MTNTTAALRSKVKDVTGALRSRRYRRRQNSNESKAGVTLRTASLPAFVLGLPKGMPAGVRSCTKCERNMLQTMSRSIYPKAKRFTEAFRVNPRSNHPTGDGLASRLDLDGARNLTRGLIAS